MSGKSFGLAVIAVLLGADLVHLAGQGPGIPGGVVFYSARDGNNEIFVMDADGGNPEPVTQTTGPVSNIDPDLSTNGQDIIFTSNLAGNNDIFLIDTHGGDPVNLTKNAANDGWARWSPNGDRIVFHSNRSGNFELYTMYPDGSGAERLTEYPGIDQFPEWSPTGQELAFRRDNDIYVLHIATRETRRLTNAPPLNQMPAWSPNGRHLAFMSTRAGYISVFVMNADGSDQRNLTPKDPNDPAEWNSRAPSWSTNGRDVYYMSSRPGTAFDTEILATSFDGSVTTRLTDSLGVDGSPRAR